MNKVSVLFVCLGNICRSPTAHAVFQSMVDSRGLGEQILVDSAGTGDWHLGHAPDKRTCAQAAERGYDMSDLRARLVEPADFVRFDYIIGMDHENISNLLLLKPEGFDGQVELFLSYALKPETRSQTVVPDPYYGGETGFALVLDLVEDAAAGLLNHLVAQLNQSPQ